MQRFVLSIAIVILLGAVANAQQPSTPDDGGVKDGVYSNSFFGFEVTYPAGWVVHGDATNTRLKEIGKERVTSSGAMSAAATEVILKNTYQLLTTFQYPLGTPNVEVNPAFMLMAENVSHAPGIVSGRDYLLYVQPMMRKTGVEPIHDEPTELVLTAQKFFRQDYRMQVSGISIQQAIIITVIKGYAVGFILSARDQQMIDELAKAVATLKFAIPPIRRGVTTVWGDPSPKADPSPSSPAKPKPPRRP